MKMTPEDYANLRDAVSPLDTEERRADYRAGRFPRADAVRDLDKRYRWDLYYAVRQQLNIGDGYSDDHTYTALRRAIPAL